MPDDPKVSKAEQIANAITSAISSLISSHNSSNDAHSTLFSGKSDTGHTHTKSEVTDFPTSMTPTSHRSTGTTYGVGNASYYGHCRCVNNLTKSSHTDGYALSAYQGYVLNDAISGKADSNHTHNNYASSSHNHNIEELEQENSVGITYFGNDSSHPTLFDGFLGYDGEFGSGLYYGPGNIGQVNYELAVKGDIPSTTWENVTVSEGTLKVNAALKLAYFEFGKAVAVTTSNSLYTVAANNIPSSYRPKRAVRFPCHNSAQKIAVIDQNGTLGIVSNSTSSLTYNGDVLWHYGE